MPLKLHSMNSCPNWNNMYGMFRKATLAYDDGVWDIAVTMWEAYMLEEKNEEAWDDRNCNLWDVKLWIIWIFLSATQV